MAPCQWMFLLQGLPTIALGIGAWFVLNDSLETAPWLTAEERQALCEPLTADDKNHP